MHYKRRFLNKALAEIALLERLQLGNLEITPLNLEQMNLINDLASKKIIEFCD